MRKQLRKMMTASLALSLLLGPALTASAAVSPEFARSAEEWAALQDDVLNYSEIPDLIHEYNTTVINNNYSYQAFIRDYGRTRTDVSDQYTYLAEKLISNKTGEDGVGQVTDFQLDQQAENLLKQADNTVEDSYVYYLQYQSQEQNLVLQAKKLFINYYSGQYSLDSAKQRLELLRRQAELASLKAAGGMATSADVLDAQEAVLSQEEAVSKQEQTIENTRKSLIVMCGWNSEALPQITELPEPDLAAIDAVNYETDLAQALENNYTLKINQRKLENSANQDNIDTYTNTIDGNKRSIGVSLSSAYQSLRSARLSYDQAQNDLVTVQRNYDLASQKYAAGMITALDYETARVDLAVQQNTAKAAALTLLSAWETYQAEVAGSASAS